MRSLLALLGGFALIGVAEADFPEFLSAAVDWSDSEAAPPADMAPVIGFIPGEIFGNPDHQRGFLPVAPAGSGEILFPLYLLADDTDDFAEPLNGRSRRAGLEIEPDDTRLLRLATFFLSRGSPRLPGAGIASAETQRDIVIVYVDQACRVTGTLDGPLVVEHDISFPSAGFHLVEFTERDDGSYSAVRVTNNTPLRFVRSR